MVNNTNIPLIVYSTPYCLSRWEWMTVQCKFHGASIISCGMKWKLPTEKKKEVNPSKGKSAGKADILSHGP